MVSLKSFLFLTHMLCVHRLYLYCVQPKISQKTLPKHTYTIFIWRSDNGKTQCVLSLQAVLSSHAPSQTRGIDFLKEIGEFGFLGVSERCSLNVDGVSSLPIHLEVPNEKKKKRSGKALQKHLFPALCFLLVLGLSKANSLPPTVRRGRWGLHRRLQWWHG